MTKRILNSLLKKLKQASEPGKVEDGTRVHLHYKSFGTPKPKAILEAQRAEELQLPRDHYTGRVSRIWKSEAGDKMLTVYVELERDHHWRNFNLNKGELLQLVVMGD
jgi:hypothetical protein